MSSLGQESDVTEVEAARLDALTDEFERALKAGQSPRIEDFLNRVAEAIRPAALRELLRVELEIGSVRGDKPTKVAYLERFPEYADVIAEAFQPSDVRLAHTIAHDSGRRRSGLHVRCPHCHNPIELVPDAPLDDVNCPSCGSNFSLTGGEEATRDATTITRLGQFELIERLGMGAFGTVWKARDTQLHRTVAIKVPRKGELGPEESEKFFREARSAAQLRHPNIVSVHEVGRDGESVYIVSDFIRGVPLSEMIADTRLSFRETAELLAKVADALHHAHEAGVVHRDLKPQNIMMDDAGEPHLMDFGLAKREAGEITITLDGAVLGTPAFMSPEQARGESHEVHRTTDIYSLGVVMFKMLTGELPFRGTARMLIHKVINDEPPSPRRMDAAIPRDLETITLKCLQKAPNRRYQTAHELAKELKRYLANEPILARPVGRWERAVRWSTRHPARFALIAVSCVAALLFVGLAVGLVFQRHLQAAYHSLEKSNQNEVALKRQLAWTAYLHAIGLAYRNWQEAEVGSARSTLAKTAEEYRHWEWHYLRRLSDGNPGNFAAHTNAIWSVACSPDGKLAASASEDGTVKVWDLFNRRCLHTMKASGFWAVAFSPDGKLLAGGSDDGVIRLWDAVTGKQVSELSGQAGAVNCLAFSPDGAHLVSAGGMIGRDEIGANDADPDVNALRIWSLDDRKVTTTLKGHDTSVWALAFAPNGQYIASGDFHGTIRIWDATTGKQLTVLDEHAHSITALVFDLHGTLLFSGSQDRTVKAWNLNANSSESNFKQPGLVKVLDWLQAPESAESETSFVFQQRSAMTFTQPGLVKSLALSRDGLILACGLHDSTIRMLSSQSGEEKSVLRGHEGQVLSMAFIAGTPLLLSGGADRTMKAWNTSVNQEFRSMRKHTDWVERLCFMPDTRQLVSGGRDGSYCIWDSGSGDLVSARHTPHGNVHCIAVSSNGQFIASGGSDCKVRIWEHPSGRLVRTLEGHTELVRDVAFSPDDRILASGGFDDRVKLWDTSSGKELYTLAGNCLAFSHDGNRLVTGGDLLARVWDVSSGRKLLTLMGHTKHVAAVAFSPDSRRVVTGSWDRTAALWDAKTGQKLFRYQGNDTICAAAFSPDGRRLILADGARLKLLLATTLEEILTLKTGGNNLHTVAFSDDGHLIAAGGWDDVVYMWDGTPLELDHQNVQTRQNMTQREADARHLDKAILTSEDALAR